MPDQLSLRGGTTAEHAGFTGANKEATVDTTKKTLVIHDGATVGGHPLMRENASNSALALGSAATPSLKFTGDTDTGIYSPGANQVAVSTNGTGRLFVDASGNVGAGVSSPATASFGNIIRNKAPVGAGSAGYFAEGANSDTWFGIYSGTGTTDSAAIIYPSTGSLRIASSTSVGVGGFSERFRIDSAGNIGQGGIPFNYAANVRNLQVNGTGYSALTLGTTDATTDEKYWRLIARTAGPDKALQLQVVNDSGGGEATAYTVTRSGSSVSSQSWSTGGSERLRITSAGLVGIGTSNVAAALDVQGVTFDLGNALPGFASDTTPVFRAEVDNTSKLLSFKHLFGGDNLLKTFYTYNALEHVWSSGNAVERMRLDSNGYVRLAAGTGGIQFNGDTAAANALDDYEEGTFTPTVSGSTTAGTATYGFQTGSYVKVGRLVHVSIYIFWTGGTGTGNLLISSLPFAVTTGGPYYPASFGLVDNIALTAGNYITGYANQNSSHIIINQSPTGGGSQTGVAYDIAGHLMLSCSYYV